MVLHCDMDLFERKSRQPDFWSARRIDLSDLRSLPARHSARKLWSEPFSSCCSEAVIPRKKIERTRFLERTQNRPFWVIVAQTASLDTMSARLSWRKRDLEFLTRKSRQSDSRFLSARIIKFFGLHSLREPFSSSVGRSVTLC